MDVFNETNMSSINVTIATGGASTLKTVSDVVITTTLVIIMLGMGCTIEFAKLVQHLRRPIGAAIGMLAQFIVLPLATFGFAHALQLEPMAAIGMLVMGCCPGGSTSNMFTYWADGDVPLRAGRVNLSDLYSDHTMTLKQHLMTSLNELNNRQHPFQFTMTSLATVLSLGMMPLNLLIYSRSWTDENLVIPYVNIVIALAMTVGPAAMGIFLRWKWDKVALVIVKISSYVGALSVVVTMTLVSLLYPFMYKASWKIYIGAFLLPFLGFAFGMIVAKLCRMDNTCCRTVALETGIQNFPLCLTLISLSFPRNIMSQLALFPLLYGVFVLTNSCIFVGGYRVIKRCKSKKEEGGNNDTFQKVPIKDYDDNFEVELDDIKRIK